MTNSCFHQVFDLQHWIQVFPLDRLRREAREFVVERHRTSPENYSDETDVERHVELMSPQGTTLVGPEDLAVVEQLRQELFAGKQIETAPTAVFVFAHGEPPDRRMTKLGGLPFRSADKAWPCDNRGQPLIFAGQLNFIDIPAAADPPLPADILLVFADLDDPFDARNLRFEWVEMDFTGPLIQQAPGHVLEALFGVMHKTWDVAALDEADVDQIEQYRRYWLLLELEGTKIAGCPSWIQGDETPDDDSLFIGSLGSISRAPDQRWPWVNAEKLIGDSGGDENWLMWGDMGCLYLFWNGREVLPVVQCY